MKLWIVAGLFLGAGALIVYGRFGPPAERHAPELAPFVEIVAPEPPKNAKASGCAAGCSLKDHPVEKLTLKKFNQALVDYAASAPDAQSEGLERLLFHGEHTRELLQQYGAGPLPPAHRAFLSRELARTHAVVALRIVDDQGIVRASYGPQRVPIGHKEHLHADKLERIQPMEFNGTVMRVGLYHLWSRY